MLAMGIAGLMIMSAPVALAADPLTGRIVGQLTKSNGEPAADVPVVAFDRRGSAPYFTRTAADGSYVLAEVAGYPDEDKYKIKFDPRWPLGLPEQWAHGKTTEADANVITVTAGQDTVVNDVLFPTGSVRVTASDKLTGAPLNRFCARGTRYGCTENGVVVLPEIPPGDYQVDIDSADYFSDTTQVTVVADQVATAHGKLAPAAKISTTVVDAATKAPVANICIYPKEGIGSFGEFINACSGPDGRVEITGLTTGDYNLWVEARDGVHGTQWLGPRGGTGSRLQAKVIHAAEGKPVNLPPIQLDKAGSISGTVVDRGTGAPVAGVCAFPRAGLAYESGPADRPSCTEQDGKYTISGLGPYNWPVNFIDNYPGTHAWQWSGDQPSQLTARHIKVNAGQTSTENARLAPGNTVSGKVTVNGLDGYLNVYNAVTGDPAGDYTIADGNGAYQFKNIAGNQLVKVAFTDASKPPYNEYWYRNATTFASARPIPVRPDTPTTGIDFVITPR
jgi:hypothetical protein